MSASSPIASHCSVFALSDNTEPDLQQKCDHSHDEVCEHRENLHMALQNISSATEELSFTTEDDRDEAMYLANSATLAIQSWKCICSDLPTKNRHA